MGYRERLASGRVAFAHLVRVWHARNGWSHRVLPALADSLGFGRVHNSQLSMLRNGKLASPGPEVFLALGEINRWLAVKAPEGRLPQKLAERQLAGHDDLIEALTASALPVRDDQGRVLGPGELLEVFVGVGAPPPTFDLRIAEAEAPALSAALADLLCAGRTWRQCRDRVLPAYPATRRQRRELFAEVMAGQRDYSGAELEAELPDLNRTLSALNPAIGVEPAADDFLAMLRRRAQELNPPGAGDVAEPAFWPGAAELSEPASGG